MRWLTALGIVVVIAALSMPGRYAIAQGEEEGPGQPRVKEKPLNAGDVEKPGRRETQKPKLEGRGIEAKGRLKPGEPAGAPDKVPFIMMVLRDFPDFQEALQQHTTAMATFQSQLADLQKQAREKLKNAQTAEDRERIIQETRQQTAVLLGQIIDETVRHQKEIADLTQLHRDEILAKAVERIFMRGQRGQERGVEGENIRRLPPDDVIHEGPPDTLPPPVPPAEGGQ